MCAQREHGPRIRKIRATWRHGIQQHRVSIVQRWLPLPPICGQKTGQQSGWPPTNPHNDPHQRQQQTPLAATRTRRPPPSQDKSSQETVRAWSSLPVPSTPTKPAPTLNIFLSLPFISLSLPSLARPRRANSEGKGISTQCNRPASTRAQRADILRPTPGLSIRTVAIMSTAWHKAVVLTPPLDSDHD